jgi:hypothetical protein
VLADGGASPCVQRSTPSNGSCLLTDHIPQQVRRRPITLARRGFEHGGRIVPNRNG